MCSRSLSLARRLYAVVSVLRLILAIMIPLRFILRRPFRSLAFLSFVRSFVRSFALAHAAPFIRFRSLVKPSDEKASREPSRSSGTRRKARPNVKTKGHVRVDASIRAGAFLSSSALVVRDSESRTERNRRILARVPASRILFSWRGKEKCSKKSYGTSVVSLLLGRTTGTSVSLASAGSEVRVCTRVSVWVSVTVVLVLCCSCCCCCNWLWRW